MARSGSRNGPRLVGPGFLLAALLVICALPASASAARYVYVSNGFPAGSNDVSALRINANGTLTAVTGSPFATGGTTTEGLAVTPDAGRLYVAEFGSNGVKGFNVNATTGALSSIGAIFTTGFTTPLGVAPDPLGRRLFTWNHGQEINVSTINANGTLTNITGSPFALPSPTINPFAGSVAPDGDHLYTPYENTTDASQEGIISWSVAASGAVTAIDKDGTGNVLPSNPFGSAITPDGRFVYVSNPEDGANGTISGFTVNANGTLTVIPGLQGLNVAPGNHPLNMAITPDGKHLYVATRISNTINAYTINANGTLTAVPGQPFATNGTDGKGVAITPDGKRLYVSNNGSDNISGFNIAGNGALSFISTTLTGGTDPDLESIAITPNQPPAASFTATAATAGQATSFDGGASADSDGGTIANYEWNFGDGTTIPNGAATAAHAYTQPGTYIASLTVTDDEGCSDDRIFTGKATLCNGSIVATTTRTVTVPAAAPPTPPSTNPPGPDGTSPRFLSASISPSSFAVDPRGRAETPVSSAARGTTFRYSLSETARVVFTIYRKTTGRRVGRSCRRTTRANRFRRKCTRLIREGRFAKLSGAGANIKRFSGRIGRKRLRVASYQLTLDARDASGNRARPVIRNFKVVNR